MMDDRLSFSLLVRESTFVWQKKNRPSKLGRFPYNGLQRYIGIFALTGIHPNGLE